MPNWTPEQIAVVVTAIATLVAALAAVASAVFALVAVRAQRATQQPHIAVTHSMVMPVVGGMGRNLAGSTLGDPWFAITVHNDGLMSVTVRNVALAFADGGSTPFIRPPWPGVDELPKPLAPDEEATFYLDELRNIAQVHIEHGGAKWATAKLGGKAEFHGEPIDRKWLDGWAKST
jgi:hypothetical protein